MHIFRSYVQNSYLVQLKGKRGVIHHIKDCGDLCVKYNGPDAFIINPAAVVKVNVHRLYHEVQVSTLLTHQGPKALC